MSNVRHLVVRALKEVNEGKGLRITEVEAFVKANLNHEVPDVKKQVEDIINEGCLEGTLKAIPATGHDFKYVLGCNFDEYDAFEAFTNAALHDGHLY